MGAYSPAPVVTPEITDVVMRDIIKPTVDGMAAEGCPFTGVIFAGLMISKDGTVKLLEHNIRFGDPECQVLMARLTSDLTALLLAAATGTLENAEVTWSDDSAVVVVMAAEGYPGSYAKGEKITNLDAAGAIDGVKVLHAGTASDADGDVVSSGGRVLGVTAYGILHHRSRRSARTRPWTSSSGRAVSLAETSAGAPSPAKRLDNINN